MRVLVCGGRDYNELAILFDYLDNLNPEPTLIIEGGARGADYLAFRYASERMIDHLRFDADWNANGKAAGPMRNQRMIDEGKPDLVVAFPGGKGTQDMVSRAKKSGVEVRIAP